MIEETSEVVVRDDGSVVLPEAIREELRLTCGTRLLAGVTNGVLTLRSSGGVVAALSGIAGRMPAGAPSFDEAVDEARFEAARKKLG